MAARRDATVDAPGAKSMNHANARSGRVITLVWLGLAIATFATALPHIDDLGMYYDEAFLAAQARDFVLPESGGRHPSSVRSVEIFGRPFPVRNAAYLGSLKSQLLIPALAIAGSTSEVVRITTLAIGLLALLLGMLWAGRIFGVSVAVLTGVLAATDPSFHFLSQFEWGPFTTNLLCRTGGLLLITAAWQSAHPTRAIVAAAGGGLLLGLGIFSRADFVLILVAGGLALLLCQRNRVREALRERLRLTGAAAAGLFVAASPMLLSVFALMSSSSAVAERGGIEYKARVLWTVLDGSHFHRLMQVGGLFDEIFDASAPFGIFGWVLLASLAYLAAAAMRRRRSAEPRESAGDGRAFLVTTALLLVPGMLLMPGAVRAHHQLNSFPFLQMIVAVAMVEAWRAGARDRKLGSVTRGLVAVVLIATVIGNAMLIRSTHALIADTGGSGRWSREIHRLAEEVDAHGDTTVVSLDWGFHEPLLFLTRNTRLVEPIWAIPKMLQHGRPWIFDGSPATVYLVHEAPYDLFGLGGGFLAAARDEGVGDADIRAYRDRQGEVAFYAVRIRRPHRLVFSGEFEIR